MKVNSSIQLLLPFKSILLISLSPALIFYPFLPALFPVGPLLTECLDVMNIPTSQIQNLTVHLSGECHLFCDRFISNSHFWN